MASIQQLTCGHSSAVAIQLDDPPVDNEYAYLARKPDALRLLDRQRIHVRPKSHNWLALTNGGGKPRLRDGEPV